MTASTPKRSRRKGCLFAAGGILLGLLLTVVIAAQLLLSYDPLVSVPDAPHSKLLIQNIRVIDVVAGTAKQGMDVAVEDGLITAITPHNADTAPQDDVRHIAGKGLSLVPGLIDVHCHINSDPVPPWALPMPKLGLNLERLLFSGVTTVLDPGALSPKIFETRAAIASGEMVGPKLYAAGPLFTAPGGHPVPMVRELTPLALLADYMIEGFTRQVGTAEEANGYVAELALLKPDFIKVAVDSIPLDAPKIQQDVAKAVVSEAEKHKLRVIAHIGSTEDAVLAGEIGASAWVHGVYKERIPDETIKTLAGFGIPMAPTLAVFRSYSEMGTPERVATPLERQIFSAEALEAYTILPEDYDLPEEIESFIAHLRTQQQSALENVKRLHDAGVTILAGSDSQTGLSQGPGLHRELDLLRDAGLTATDILRSATYHNARFLTQKDDPPFGVVAVGKEADLLLIKGDPLTDHTQLSNLEVVIVDGVVIERHAISN